MAGIYIHIPFCKQACHYCNFHFSTSLRHKGAMLLAIEQEIELQKDYLQGQKIESVYFGGGTPSLLTPTEINRLFEKLTAFHPIDKDAEITLEANPDDLSLSQLNGLKTTPINRLSIGIQSFSEEDLRQMNRAHSGEEAINCLQNAQSVGFHNLTVDLIYGANSTSDTQWAKNIDILLEANIPHISSYALTIEPKTPLAKMIRQGVAQATDEDKAVRQFQYLVKTLGENGFIHYEISNFAKEGAFAKHNANYWKGVHYLGLGASAHSFNGFSRQWNIANNLKYIHAIETGNIPSTVEILSPEQQYNEYVMTSLRTVWGCNLEKIKLIESQFATHFEKEIQVFIASKDVVQNELIYTLTEKGKLLADGIASELFLLGE